MAQTDFPIDLGKLKPLKLDPAVTSLSDDAKAALRHMGYRIVPLPPWGTGNAVEAIGIAPAGQAQAKALGFPRPGMLYGAADSRAPAGSAVGVDDNQEVR